MIVYWWAWLNVGLVGVVVMPQWWIRLALGIIIALASVLIERHA